VVGCFYGSGHLDAGQLIEIVDRLRIMGTVTDDTLIFATHISHEGNDTYENMLTLAKAHNYNIAYDGLTVNL
jgi:phosphoribosyl 1,2-cyclic phosphate phosphodiesterase